MRHSTYFDHADPRALAEAYPPGPAFLDLARLSPDEMRVRQEKQFARLLSRAWKTGFYRRLWGAKGIEPGDIRGLEDLAKLPTFEKSDIVASIAAHPPFGDFAGLDSYEGEDRPPIILHTTSGTTGRPQPLLFGPRTREVQNILLGRLYRFQGLRPDDVAHSVYGHGMINGGHYIREAVTRWTGATFLSAGTGVETRSQQQVQLMKEFGVSVILGFADYVKRLAEVAAEAGLVIGEDIRVRMISGQFGREDKAAVSRLWGGADCFDWYGVGDTGVIAGEGPDKSGLYVFEDAHLVEVCDIDSGAIKAHGEEGDLVVTCLFKDDVYPIIRLNTHDVTRFVTDASPLGLNWRRIEGFLGRSDNMVKIRGINVFPQALGPMMSEVAGFTGEYVCRAVRDAQGRDDLVIVVESRAGDISAQCREQVRRVLGIEPQIEVVAAGATAALTQIETRQKPIRLIDERFT